ncbi:MAG: MlaE family lipid ABC transporter permease subunit [Alphaproteobacteria bacterium]
MNEDAWVRSSREGETATIAFGGRWNLAALARQDAALRAIDAGGAPRAVIDLSALTALDAAGAWALQRLRSQLRAGHVQADFAGGQDAHLALLERLDRVHEPTPVVPPRGHLLIVMLARLGAGAERAWSEAIDTVGFFGHAITTAARVILRPANVRVTSLLVQMEQAGLNALPIVGLLTFLIGVVLAYQGIDQLRRFGAEVFTVNLAGISILREVGVLMTAILIAGRSGSAFTAQIGTMKVREEIDAMRTLGLDPVEILVLPRLLALVLTMPLLGFYADVVGLFGAAVSTMLILDLSPLQFMSQLREAVEIKHFWVGIIKAPVFGFIIALVGCRYGLKVKGSAENVGRRTTQSVVEAIFLVIVADAIFSIVFSRIGY